MGTAADLVLKPYGAIAIGVTAGLISTLGYAYLTVSISFRVMFIVCHWLTRQVLKCKLHRTNSFPKRQTPL